MGIGNWQRGKNESSATLTPAQELKTDRPGVQLDGCWSFRYDPEGIGSREGWQRPDIRFPESVVIPGCPQTRRHPSARSPAQRFQGLPEQQAGVGLRYPCLADAWFQQRFDVPRDWQGQRLVLHVGGVMPAAEFWLNGHPLGLTLSSRCALRADITRLAQVGGSNVLTARVFRPERRLDGCFDWLGCNSLYRSVRVEAVPDLHLTEIYPQTRISPRSVTLTVTLARAPRRDEDVRVAVKITAANGASVATASLHAVPGRREATLSIPLPGARLWQPDDPALTTATLRLFRDGQLLDVARLRFGLREIKVDGFTILLNGRPVFLRGGCDDHLYSDTVMPPADVAFYRQRIRQAQAYGFNYTKSCVEVFTPEFLEAADELGYLVCQEMPFGMMGEARERRYNPPAWYAALCRRELAHIIRTDRHHPSVIMYSMSSELSVKWEQNRASFRLFCQELPDLARTLNPAALVVDCTGISRGPSVGSEAVPLRTRAGRRHTDLEGSWLHWGNSFCPLTGPLSGLDRVTLPFLFHEYVWITALSDPALIRRLAGTPLIPLHIPDMVRAARRNHQGSLLAEEIEASRALKHELRKYALELARREPKAAGYHHWLIHDFPFCAEGVLNEFWEPPADLPASEFREYCADTILMLVDHDQRCFACGGTAPVGIQISHFGSESIAGARLEWILSAGKRRIAGGGRPVPRVACGSIATLAADLGLRLPTSRVPQVLELRVSLRSNRRVICTNHWKLWAFPESGVVASDRAARVFSDVPELVAAGRHAGLKVEAMPGRGAVVVTERLTDDILAFVEAGGRVLHLSRSGPEASAFDLEKAPGVLYRSVPYNEGTRGNMGTLMRSHPALGGLPHDNWCDLLFAPLIQNAHPVALAPFKPRRIDPIIRSIGHMRTLDDKAYLFELGVGRGRLLVTSLRLIESAESSPLARHLLRSMVGYLAAARGAPANPVPASVLRRVRRPKE